jgi:hypothetical protein
MLIIIPFGRLGNNISQLIKCLTYSLSFQNPIKINLTLLKQNEPFFNSFPDYLFDNNEIEYVDTFWDYGENYNLNFEKAKDIIMNFIDYKINIDINIDFTNSLIIHFRGGDSFNYLDWYHPPYYFYKNIIDNSDYKNILLVIEDYSNPIINKLLENYSNCKAINNNYIQDFKILMNSIYFVDSQSTFSSSALIFNKNIKTLYTSNIMHTYRKNFENINVITYDLEKYHNKKFSNIEELKNFLLLENDIFL